MSQTNFPAVTEGTIGEAAVQTVNARDLHAFLGVGKQFGTWITDRIAQYAFNENNDFVVFPEIGKNPSGGRPSKEYALTIDMAKELAMVERNEKGKAVRRYFIECERKAKEASRAKAEIDFSDPVIALGYVQHLQGQVTAAKAQIADLRPKAEALSRIAISDGSLCITDAAKTLQVQPKWLFRWMREHEWIYGRVGTSHDVGYQAKIAAGFLEHKVTSVYRSDGTEKTVTQVRVTPKGLAKLGELLSPSQPPSGGAGSQPSTLFGLVMAGMVALGLLGNPQPARALPTPMRDGLAIFYMNGEPITVDTNRFEGGPFQHFLCIGGDGKLDRCLLRSPARNEGNRAFWEQDRARRPGEAVSAHSVSGIVHVIGAIVA